MSEFDNLKNDAEKYAKDHPDQVEKGEQAVEHKLGLPDQGQSGSDQPGSDQGSGPAEDQQNAGPGGGE